MKRDYDRAFMDFARTDFRDAMETNTATPKSPEIWEWRDNSAWTMQALAPFKHTGVDGC